MGKRGAGAKDGWWNRYTVACSEPRSCPFRPCMWPGENKGPYTPGRGYTSYYARPEGVCMERHSRGCPAPKPAPDPERARCCYRPDYRRREAAPVKWRTCATCGAVAPVWAAAALNTLPAQPGVPCRHEAKDEWLAGVPGWYQCGRCRGGWDHRPRPFEAPNRTSEELLAAIGGLFKRGDLLKDLPITEDSGPACRPAVAGEPDAGRQAGGAVPADEAQEVAGIIEAAVDAAEQMGKERKAP